MKTFNYFLLVLLCTLFSSTAAFSYDALPSVVSGTITFTKTTTIGPRAAIPDNCNKIIINAGVTVYGNFYIKGTARDFTVMGKDRNTSIIDGSKTTFVKGDRTLSAVRVDNSGSVTIKTLTSKNCANFHFTGFSSAVIDDCKIIQPNGQMSVDGVHFAKKATINNCFIDIHDDVSYVGETTKISNSTIYHNKNGAIAMCSWGQTKASGTTTFDKCKLYDNHTGTDYSHGVVGWAQKVDNAVAESCTVEFISTTWGKNTGKTQCSYFYSFGRAAQPLEVKKAYVQQYGGDCGWADKVMNRKSTINNIVYQSSGVVYKPASCPKSAAISEEVINNETPKTITVIPSVALGNQTLEFHLPLGIETEPANLKIYNTSGQCVQSMRFCSDFGNTITLKNLKPGMHLLTAEVGGEVYKTKLIVK